MKALKLKKEKGFTLIELMIVVAIIGILAAIAIPKFADLVTKSKEAAVKGNLGAIRSAVSIYYGDSEGVFPANLYDGITANGKYMSSKGFGKFELPGIADAGFIGHRFPNYQNVDTYTKVTQGLIPAAGTQDHSATPALADLPLFYVNSALGLGELYVNCSHNDTKTNAWTSY